MKVYVYKNCGTCKKALKWLEQHAIEFDPVPIRETPPSRAEIKRMIQWRGGIRPLFNTSGGDYKALGLKDKVGTMTLETAVELLAKNGNLVKRPFVLGNDFGLVGFNEQEWRDALL